MTAKEAPFGTPMEELRFLQKLEPVGNAFWLRFEYIAKALTELDRLRVFKQTFDNYELAKKQDFIAYENWQECETEHSQLVQDVKRYFELNGHTKGDDEKVLEWFELFKKLSKVGREE